MKVYHGSNVIVEKPKILTPINTADFGIAFYTTSSEKQAKDWAKTKRRRRKSGTPSVSIYLFDEVKGRKVLQIKEFTTANEEWLDFIVANRRGTYQGKPYDLIIGPVADDKTITVLDDYMAGNFPKAIALQLLEPQNLVDQYAFTTHKALKCLTYQGAKTYDI